MKMCIRDRCKSNNFIFLSPIFQNFFPYASFCYHTLFLAYFLLFPETSYSLSKNNICSLLRCSLFGTDVYKRQGQYDPYAHGGHSPLLLLHHSGRRQRLCSGFFCIFHSGIPSLCLVRKFFRRTDRHALVLMFYS